ncbi:hypothetical protein PF66_03492 [Pseudomonas asplenii]|uniref:Uncharacterized protein n=1 Tax=Pseudomonas asplenii TaxID=53407 RepID=A0A0N0E3F9_9PSED|nr:glycosyltransferase family 1 protein [Pseudomonas fuscovaginae]KPA90029.1 hypothetical protein PF66_03492 [Pseudomonas fuscovaginae]
MNQLAVAVPWNQSHYIPWRGCHPLYRALFESMPEGVSINAWDNVALRHLLERSEPLRQRLLAALASQSGNQWPEPCSSCFGPESRLLTQALPGAIEFFHSIAFPSLSRPFVLHCESLRGLFAPWTTAQASIGEQLPRIREHYRALLGGPWCLGVFSAQADTLVALNDFLGLPQLQSRLFTSRLGLPVSAVQARGRLPDKPSLARPRFLFVSVPDHESDFFSCGGHRVLRFWKAFCAAGHNGLLSMACERPDAQALVAAGVDLAFVEQQTGRSILWASPAQADVEALMAGSHVLLQPADVLCPFEILQAMSLGCVPVVSALRGVGTYLQDGQGGLIVGTEPEITDPWLLPVRQEHEQALLVDELLARIPGLLQPQTYLALQEQGHRRAVTEFSGQAFAGTFWAQVRQLHVDSSTPAPSANGPGVPLVDGGLLDMTGLRRAFSQDARPRMRINTGERSVWSVGGCFVLVEGNSSLHAHDCSVLAQYTRTQARPAIWANSLLELAGAYLPQEGRVDQPEPSALVKLLSRWLMPFPWLHSQCSQWLRRYRRARQPQASRTPSPPVGAAEQPHLVVEGFHGYNIIRYGKRFYAILQSDGAFEPKHLETSHSGRYHSDVDLQAVEQLVIASLAGGVDNDTLANQSSVAHRR